MKIFKQILPALMLGALAVSCTSLKSEQRSGEIDFQVARYSTATKADPADYKDAYQSIPFGTYAWYKGLQESDNTTYFANRPVGYEQERGRWTTIGTTYYWPLTGTLDFISYSPYTADGTDAPAPAIGEDYIRYSTPWNVDEHPEVDIMYADKAIGLSGNASNTFNHGYDGVPTLFRHALARIEFRLRAGICSRTAADGEITSWEIDINSITLENLLTTGTLSLSLAEDGTWEKPETNAWSATAPAVSRPVAATALETLTEEAQSAGGAFFVLPQQLDAQRLTLDVTIRTYRDKQDGSGAKLIITEKNVPCHAALKTDVIDTWGINQYITYILTIYPIDPEENDTILFDPAVADWERKFVETEILL